MEEFIKEIGFYLKSIIKIIMIMFMSLYILNKYSLVIYSGEKIEDIVSFYNINDEMNKTIQGILIREELESQGFNVLNFDYEYLNSIRMTEHLIILDFEDLPKYVMIPFSEFKYTSFDDSKYFLAFNDYGTDYVSYLVEFDTKKSFKEYLSKFEKLVSRWEKAVKRDEPFDETVEFVQYN